MKTITLILLFGALYFSFGQSDLPEYGSIADLKGKTKVYVIAAADHRKLILMEIKNRKDIVNVDRAEDAEFFIEYKTISREQPMVILGGTGMSSEYENGQLDVYLIRDTKKVIAWSEAKNLGWYQGLPSRNLTKQFLKTLGKK